MTPPQSPGSSRLKEIQSQDQPSSSADATPQPHRRQQPPSHIDISHLRQPSPTRHDETIRPRPRQRRVVNLNKSEDHDTTIRAQNPRPRIDTTLHAPAPLQEKIPEPIAESSSASASQSAAPLPNFLNFITDSSQSQSIAERAWMMKMAAEVARRYEDERNKGSFGVPVTPTEGSVGGEAPPAYAR